jgi:transposase
MEERMSEGILYLGLDLGNEQHALCVVDDAGKVLLERTVKNDFTALELVVAQKGALAPSAVHIAVEDKNNALVDALLGHGFSVFAINPKQVDRFRERSNVAGAKDDRRDARVLATTVRTDADSYCKIELGSAERVELCSLSVSVDNLARETRRTANRLRAQILRSFPTLLALCPGADELWYWDLLRDVVIKGEDVDDRKVAEVLKVRRKRNVKAKDVVGVLRRQRLQTAPGVQRAAYGEIGRLVEQLYLLDRQHRGVCAEHNAMLTRMKGTPECCSDVDIVMSVPGFGPKTTAVFITNAAPLFQLNGGLAIVRALGGVAPVTKRSGKKSLVVMRKACDPRLREALFHASMVAVQHDERFAEQYRRLRAASHGHARALRGVADRLLGILAAMLRTRTLYRPLSAPAPAAA